MEYVIDSIKSELRSGALDLPPEHVDADFAVTFHDPTLAKNAAGKIKSSDLISEAKAEGPFLNIKLNKPQVYEKVLTEVSKLGDKYGNTKKGKGKKVFIEYSSPNVAKPFGVGHLRSTVIGEALAKIYESAGYKVFRENHLGDWGAQFGGLIYAYQNWEGELKDLYVRFQEEAEKDENLKKKGREVFRRLEEGDKKFLRLWKSFRKESIEEFKKIYDRLGIKFDHIGGESEFVKDAVKITELCLKKKVCQKGKDKSVVVELADLPSFLLRKEDGSTLYITRDLAALTHRVKKHKPDTLLYVVGSEQNLHFKQLFALGEKLGLLKGVEAKHIPFGLVLIEGKKMASRKGTVVELEEVMNDAVLKAKKIIEEKNPDLENKDEVAEMVGVGAIQYNDLRQSREKNITFHWERMLNFEGGSSAYLQYTYARIQSILKKAKEKFKTKHPVYESDTEFRLAKSMMMFPQAIINALSFNSPHIIAVYLEDLAQIFNSFYNKVPVIKTKNDKLRKSRLQLIESTGIILKRGLNLLNIKTPNNM